MNKFSIKWFLDGLLLGVRLRSLGQGYIALVFVSKSIISLSSWYFFCISKSQIKMKAVSPLCGSTERALGSWPAKQPSAVHEGAGRQQTTLFTIRTLHYPVEVKMWKHQLCASRQVDTKQDINFFFNIIVHHLHTKRYGKTLFLRYSL